MLVGHTMSKEVDPKLRPPSVVARLMGLEGLPEQPVSTSPPETNLQTVSSKRCSISKYQLKDNCFHERLRHRDNHAQLLWENKDKQSPKQRLVKDRQKYNGKQMDNAGNKKMAPICPKIVEEKGLAIDEKPCRPKDYYGSLNILNSDSNLFLELLREPSSQFLQNLYKLPSFPMPDKRITILKPSRTSEMDGTIGYETKCVQIKKQHQADESIQCDSSDFHFSYHKDGSPPQPTRIVVLKPSPVKKDGIKMVASSPISSPGTLQCGDFFGQSESSSIDISGEGLSISHKDEPLPVSKFPLEQKAKESSSNSSKNRCFGEENLGDSDSVTPCWNHSRYYDREGTPYSEFTFSRISCSSESSVTREGKKHLSERLAMVALASSHEQGKEKKRSSTLGEMLSLSNASWPIKSALCDGEQRMKARSHLMNSGEDPESSFKNLSRLRCIPLPSITNESTTDSSASSSTVSMEVATSKNCKSLLKGKVSGSFFSRIRKSGKGKPGQPSSIGNQDGLQTTSSRSLDASQVKELAYADTRDLSTNSCLDEASISFGKASCQVQSRTLQNSASSEESFSWEKIESPVVKSSESPLQNSSENPLQPSPISVLEVQFDDEIDTHPSLPESAAKTLWDENVGSPASLFFGEEPPAIPSGLDNEERRRFSFVQELLSAAGLDQEKLDMICHKWNSSDSHLDPALLPKCMVKREDYKKLNEAELMQWTLDCRLLFDRVNEAMRDKASCCRTLKPGTSVMKEVWLQVKECFCSNNELFSTEMDTWLRVEREVRKQVVGFRWDENEMTSVEMDDFGKEIQDVIMEELVEEALADFICWRE